MGERRHGQEAWNLPSEVRAGTCGNSKKRKLQKYLIECTLFLCPNYHYQVNTLQYHQNLKLMFTNETLLSPIMVRTQKRQAYFKSDNRPAVQRLSGVLWFLRVQEKRVKRAALRCMTSFGIVRAGFKRPLQPVAVEKRGKTKSSKYCHFSLSLTSWLFYSLCLKISPYCSPL